MSTKQSMKSTELERKTKNPEAAYSVHSEGFAQLDDRLRRLTDTILPKHPYLLTVPTDVPFHLGSRYAKSWNIGLKFAPDEETLQYLSFVSHEGEDSLFRAVGGWSDDDGNILKEDKTRPGKPLSEASTLLTGAQRKKITLSDYKNKPKSASATAESATDKISTVEQSSKQSESKAQSTGVSRSHLEREVEPPDPVMSTSQKRSHEDMQSGSGLNRPPLARAVSPGPEKKPRLSSPPIITSKEAHTKESSTRRSVVKEVPKLASPTLPSSKLPKLVSPTLPPALANDLATPPKLPKDTLGHKRTASVKSTVSKAESAKVSEAEDRILSKIAPNDKDGLRMSVNPVIPTPSPQTVAPDSLKDNSDVKGVEVEKRGTTNPAHISKQGANEKKSNGVITPSRPQLVIRLKYGKKYRRNIESLLKFAPSKKASNPLIKPEPADGIYDSGKDEPVAKTDSDQQVPLAIKAEKRSRPLLESPAQEPPSKRQKFPQKMELSEKPKTPIPLPFNSPSLPNSAVSKSYLSTPQKELKGVAMRRVASADGDVRTPQSASRLGTPGSVEKLSTTTKNSPPNTVTSSGVKSSDEERKVWRQETAKYLELGRKLKHEAVQYIRPDVSDAEAKLGAALAVEAVLCFMLQFTTIDRRNLEREGWRSIIPYWATVRHATRAYPHLFGLCLCLGAVCRQVIHKMDMDRLASDPLPDEQGLAPTPGSDGTTSTNEESSKYKRKYMTFKGDMVDNYRDSQQLWLDSSRRISPEVLAKEYPQVWAGRSKDFLTRGSEKLLPGKYLGSFFLPLDSNSSSIEAVRFGRLMLGEWCSKNSVDWTPKLTLS